MAKETPPRAWGRPAAGLLFCRVWGNTPTSVGKTSCQGSIVTVISKHPHERGEDLVRNEDGLLEIETPPRAWGRPCWPHFFPQEHRNTPTSVGKTLRPSAWQGKIRKHPHERGEDFRRESRPTGRRETPPRAWGRRQSIHREIPEGGNTPTSVGKTTTRPAANGGRQKHPHERGEDAGRRGAASVGWETPPRAWGRPSKKRPRFAAMGNTPTSVGKTARRPFRLCKIKKHPHERGEDHFSTTYPASRRETPPRAWGRHDHVLPVVVDVRNTPTSVGKTQRTGHALCTAWKHPHERGEDR